MQSPSPTTLSTVSVHFIEDWIDALRSLSPEPQLEALLRRAGLSLDPEHRASRVTLDQIVQLYQLAAVETGDEMMGLWSRPIRARALQHLLTTVREARSISSALYRFSTFWNLLLDDYHFELHQTDKEVTLALVPQGVQEPQRFGHMLILKLAHGLMSWLARYELPVTAVSFCFARPDFAEDYATVFPAPVAFDAAHSVIRFAQDTLGPIESRSTQDLTAFLRTAPRDWMFTQYREHTQSLRVRELIYRSDHLSAQLGDVAGALGMTPRTLMRRLEADGTSFQTIKDALRRDMAILELGKGVLSIEDISAMLGFSSAANFHRAFAKWTGRTPGNFRK